MRFFSTLLFVSVVSLPSLAAAQDAGAEDAGLEDAGSADASTSDASPDVPDASDVDVTSERCLDGYDRSYLDACSGKAPGAVCTFPGGEAGQCAALRCLDAAGAPITQCVALTGQPAPAIVTDAGLADAGADVDGALDGGGCAVAAAPDASWLALLALGLFVRRRR